MRFQAYEGSRVEKLAFRIPDAAAALSVSESKVKRLIRCKRLGHIKDDGTTLITRRQIESYLREKELEQGWLGE